MTPYYTDDQVTLFHGDCLEVLPTLPDASVDAVVTDPPYGLEFMGKEWDTFPVRQRGQGGTGSNSEWAGGVEFSTAPAAMAQFQAWCAEWATEALRVLKPGGHLVAFGGTRTWHRLACAIEDAGFEIRDSLAWLYGSGFPKSLDVSKAIDKRKDWAALPRLQAKVKEARTALGISQSEAARRAGIIGPDESLGGGGFMWFETGMRIPTREQYPQIKSALLLDDECDRAFEEAEREITGTVDEWSNRTNYALTSRDGFRRDTPATDAARQWQGWGTALKPAYEPIVLARKPLSGTVAATVLEHGTGALNIDGCRVNPGETVPGGGGLRGGAATRHEGWQRQSHLDGDATPSHTAGRWPANVLLDADAAAMLDRQSGVTGPGSHPAKRNGIGYESGAKGTTGERRDTDTGGASRFFYTAKADQNERPRVNGVAHPTVKPLDLMCWLVRLVTPPGGVVLEPFAGSGTTAEACVVEGFYCIAIEREADYLPLIVARLSKPIERTLL